MAPGRKRGANNGKATNQLNLGDLVLAKVKGFPAWPAKISRPEDWDLPPDPKKYFVEFFGTKEIAFVAPNEVQEFTTEVKNKLSAKCVGKPVKPFTLAVKEICEAIERSGRKSSTNPGVIGSLCASVENMVSIDSSKYKHMRQNYPSEGNTEKDDSCRNEVPVSAVERKESKINVSSSCDTKRGMQDKSGPSSQNGKPTPSGVAVDISRTKLKINGIDNDGMHPSFLHADSVLSIASTLEVSSCTKDDDKICRRENLKVAKAKRTKRLVSNGCNLVEGHAGIRGNSYLNDELVNKNHRGSSKENGDMLETVDICQQKNETMLRNRNSSCVVDGSPVLKLGMQGTTVVKENGELVRIANGKLFVVTNGASNAVKKSKCYYTGFGNAEIPFALERVRNSVVSSSNVEQHEDIQQSLHYLKTEKNSEFEQSIADSDVMLNQLLESGEKDLMMNENGKSGDVELSLHSVKIDKISEPNMCEQSRAVSDIMLNRILESSDEDLIMNIRQADFSGNQLQSEGENVDSCQQSVSYLTRGDEAPECEQSIRTVDIPSSYDLHQTVSCGSVKASTTPNKCEVEDSVSKKTEWALFSPKQPPFTVSPSKTVSQQYKAAKTKDFTSGAQADAPSVPSKSFLSASVGSSDQVTSQMNDHVSKGEVNKPTHETNASSIADKNLVKDNAFSSGRVDGDRLSLLAYSVAVDASMSMKHLIETAQAKRRQDKLQKSENVHFTSFSFSDFPNGEVNLVDTLPYPKDHSATLSSLPDHSHRVMENESDIEVVKAGRRNSVDNVSGSSYCGGTDEAVARDAFEGMLETLTRTKDSIGRATRLAIDCAKYGIANEVIDLLVRMLESEPSFHRRVDLFFLVDSITQCSHSQKGIARASYIPAVQAALPRLLGAAAPHCVSARENRRQCRKVLRLWIKRNIFSNSFLRCYIDDIGTSSDDVIGRTFVKHPCRNERAFDDPVREMEGVLFDEYGSNATFEFPSLLPSHAFEVEDNGLPSKLNGDVSLSECVDSTGVSEVCGSVPSDRRQCILEGVDGELEMEDACCDLRKELIFKGTYIDLQDEGCGGMPTLHTHDSINAESLQEDCPPLPAESPPRIPSPPPVSLQSPPPPPTSLPIPPPPPPYQVLAFSSQCAPFLSQPPPYSFQPTPLPQQLLLPHQPHPPPIHLATAPSQLPLPSQPLVPPSQLEHSCQQPQSVFQPPPPGPPPLQPYSLPSDPSYHPSLPHPPLFVLPSEYSSYCSTRPPDPGNNPHPLHCSQQFHVGNMPFVQRPLQPTTVPRCPTRFSQSNFHSLQQPQLYACPYTFGSHLDGLSQNVSSERGEISSVHLNVGCQQGWWMGNQRTSRVQVVSSWRPP